MKGASPRLDSEDKEMNSNSSDRHSEPILVTICRTLFCDQRQKLENFIPSVLRFAPSSQHKHASVTAAVKLHDSRSRQ